jgi:hypothetical protein
MKNEVLLLIEDSIVNAKLLNALEGIGIDASLYNLNCPAVVFDLLGLGSEEKKDELYGLFFDLIREGETIDFAESREELRFLAEKVYFRLLESQF